MEDLEISGPKRGKKSKKRSLIVQDDDDDSVYGGNGSNPSQSLVLPKKKSFMDKFCGGDFNKNSNNGSVHSNSQGDDVVQKANTLGKGS